MNNYMYLPEMSAAIVYIFRLIAFGSLYIYIYIYIFEFDFHLTKKFGFQKDVLADPEVKQHNPKTQTRLFLEMGLVDTLDMFISYNLL